MSEHESWMCVCVCHAIHFMRSSRFLFFIANCYTFSREHEIDERPGNNNKNSVSIEIRDSRHRHTPKLDSYPWAISNTMNSVVSIVSLNSHTVFLWKTTDGYFKHILFVGKIVRILYTAQQTAVVTGWFVFWRTYTLKLTHNSQFTLHMNHAICKREVTVNILHISTEIRWFDLTVNFFCSNVESANCSLSKLIWKVRKNCVRNPYAYSCWLWKN